MSTELRFVQKLDGRKILEVRSTRVVLDDYYGDRYEWTEWAAVPMVVEEKDIPPDCIPSEVQAYTQ